MSDKDVKQIKRLMKIGTILVSIAFIFSLVMMSIFSIFLASLDEKVKSYIDTSIASSIPKPVNSEEIAKEVSKIIDMPKPKDGESPECLKEASQCRGQDSFSTHTVTKKETVVYEPIPGKDGKDAPRVQFGITKDGKQVWKYEDDSLWQEIPVVDIMTGKLTVNLRKSDD